MATLLLRQIEIPVGSQGVIKGHLVIPDECRAVVIFSHGSGSSRNSVRNKHVASYLNDHHFATLLMDLLTTEEDSAFSNRFDIDLLTERLINVTSYIQSLTDLRDCTIGYFGASTGAASALKAAAELGPQIGAVVSRGGRPDLASAALPKVKAPVLLIVGSLDKDVIMLNRKAFVLMDCEKQVVIIDGASHLFEEYGKLDEVARLAGDWFKKYLLTK
jgi:pimeloyl-ACP methyl ester carboxylesterase